MVIQDKEFLGQAIEESDSDINAINGEIEEQINQQAQRFDVLGN